MTKVNKIRKRQYLKEFKEHGRFIKIHSKMTKSEAWKSLPIGARAIFLEIYLRYDGTNNGGIVVGIKEFSKYLGISPPTLMKYIKELLQRGFIVKKFSGMFTLKKASEYAITEQSDGTGPPQQLWKYWRPGYDLTDNETLKKAKEEYQNQTK